ncbi:hypothetical protein [Novosphingobium soli]|uniref:Uncharacterized protein n=1 Tax=Novosphingobium soli TaxID=574956 RepID=A0ABV6CRH5_9SPHN
MIFYTAVEPGTLHTRIVGTQADARAINREFTQIDIPVGKPERMAWANDMQRQIDELRDALGRAAVDEPNGNSAEILEPAPVQARITSNDDRPMETAPILAGPQTEIMELDATRLAPIAEQAVERVGELGETAFEAIDAFQAGNGVGGSFSRGVHILSVLCAGEHQLTRMLFRARKKIN